MLKEIYAAIDSSTDVFVAGLQRLLRQPSVTTDGDDCRVCAELVCEMIREAGFEARVLESSHNPVVCGWSEQRDDRKTLLITGHYDVVPPGPEDAWSSPPYEAAVRDGDIVARGACDPKGNFLAALNAAAVWHQQDQLPVNVKFLIEGDDETPGGVTPGAVGLTYNEERFLVPFVDAHRDLLQADGVLLVDGGFTRDGFSPIHLGTAGSLALKLSVKTGSCEPYFIWTQIIPDAAYRIVWALSTLKDTAERVTVEGFYDDVRAPDSIGDKLMQQMPWEDKAELDFWGARQFVTGASGIDAVRRLLYEPTCSIHGLAPGMERPNSDSLIPAEAHAWINFHLVPDQRPDDILEKVRRHLDKSGFEDVKIEVFRKLVPISATPGSLQLGEALLRAAHEADVPAYLLRETFELGWKWCGLGKQLGIGGAMIGIGNPDRRAHFPNEHITIDYFIRGTKWVAASLWEYGHLGSSQSRKSGSTSGELEGQPSKNLA
ncbi:MAG TPA: M20/M25/M40 family metallo-hydrolase [Nitrososphaerales archaeon]|nr:M20/M25/M40 family metallo-hydrolase [Nitrososphaerales archaeon]